MCFRQIFRLFVDLVVTVTLRGLIGLRPCYSVYCVLFEKGSLELLELSK